MKKLLFFILVNISAILPLAECRAAMPMYAPAKACATLGTAIKCDPGTTVSGQIDWNSRCDSTYVVGVSICSSTPGPFPGYFVKTLGTSTTVNENRYCWCRMIGPLVSDFVYALDLTGTPFCQSECALYCSNYISNNSNFRSGIFSGLSF